MPHSPEPPSALPRSNARGRAARQRLLGAALEAFATRGFHGTTTREIAIAAGMSSAALYAHYPSKEHLLFELSLAGHRAVNETVFDALEGVSGSTERLATVAREHSTWHARCHEQARVVQYEMAALTADHRREIAGHRRRLELEVRTIIQDGVATGEFVVEDPSSAALAALSLGIDVARWYRNEGRWTPEMVGERYQTLIVRMVSR